MKLAPGAVLAKKDQAEPERRLKFIENGMAKPWVKSIFTNLCIPEDSPRLCPNYCPI